MKIYPDCPVITRTIEIGGLTNIQLTQKMQQHAIMMNEYGERLLTDERFTTSETTYSLKTIELTVRNLGFPDGATLPTIFKRASELGLELCPHELGPHLRLKYLDQPEGHSGISSSQHQAPSGSITIASEIISEDDDFPKGFYIRKINDELWLRGYVADHLHVWNPNDHFIFCQAKNL
ncbi:helicase [Oceanobacillus polygoni]|uniref:Helicase n=1 Tax=Oceanobacillus polygoni TaxID=1235259 RepID=A0A9X0YT90_9BACI|nr:helicase [Oceanobacillus polygoni]MBP2078422.1 hypothetical protein [Oceanobacillus polygoni]